MSILKHTSSKPQFVLNDYNTFDPESIFVRSNTFKIAITLI